ncbi:MAG TPA: hypothetical protein VHV55_16865 [Pirellulales bacterium]|nr:hypothetical protein [Pirellulales bacterium]
MATVSTEPATLTIEKNLGRLAAGRSHCWRLSEGAYVPHHVLQH